MLISHVNEQRAGFRKAALTHAATNLRYIGGEACDDYEEDEPNWS